MAVSVGGSRGGRGDSDLQEARRLLAASRTAIAFTGAGVSTASGIPDFRSPGGMWSRYRPVTFQEFKASKDARRRYWRYKLETFDRCAEARPNAVHLWLAGMEQAGRLVAVITQNIDGLHQVAGSRRVLELHGTNQRVTCLDCGRSCDTASVHERLRRGCEVPDCQACGGLLKTATVSFGQDLPRAVLDEAFSLATAADVLLVLGTSLLVHPAASVPEAAAEAGAALVIVNREPTPLDRLAAVVLHDEVERIVPALTEA